MSARSISSSGSPSAASPSTSSPRLVGYTLWRFVSAITDSEHRGGNTKGLAIRAGSFFSGVFFVIGGSLVIAAMKHNPSAARTTSGALSAMPDPVFTVVAFGLIAYGVYALVNARYRRM